MTEPTNNESAAEIDRYVSTWVRVLTIVRGCSAEDARRWAAPLLRGHLELTIHEPAAYWVAPALAPAEFIASLDPESLSRLHASLQFAMDQGDSFWQPRSDEELQQIHQRVLAVLDDYRKQLPPNAVSEVLRTDLPKSEGLELGVRVVIRHWRRSAVIDPVRRGNFGSDARVSFAKAPRVLLHGPEGDAHLWWDAFGLNLVVTATLREKGAALLEAARFAFSLNNFRDEPPVARVAA